MALGPVCGLCAASVFGLGLSVLAAVLDESEEVEAAAAFEGVQ
jgi:hypothetical protein